MARKFLTGGAERFLYGPKATKKFANFARRVARFAVPARTVVVKRKPKLPKFLKRYKPK